MRAQNLLAIASHSFSWDPSSSSQPPPYSHSHAGAAAAASACRRGRRRPLSSSSSSSFRIGTRSLGSHLSSSSFVPGRAGPNKRRLRSRTHPNVDEEDAATTSCSSGDDSKFQKSTNGKTKTARAAATKRPRPSSRKRGQSSSSSQPTMSTAVCVVPPDDAWDAIQRARHLARDTTFYRWPPAIRLFHPFAPRREIPSLVGRMAEWMEEDMMMSSMTVGEMEEGEESMLEALERDGFVEMEGENEIESPSPSPSSSSYLESFEVTLDSIQILPHWEVLEARIDALEMRIPQKTLGESKEEKERRERTSEGMALIREEERMGLQRKKERERKRRLREEKRAREEQRGGGEEEEEGAVVSEYDETTTSSSVQEDNSPEDVRDDHREGDDNPPASNGFNGPCVVYLSPDDESRARLESLRTKLRDELFPSYDAFSPSSSVSPQPEQLPRKARESSLFRPLLPIARFSSVSSAIKVAKVLQQTWDPLTFNVTDVQFVSREEGSSAPVLSDVSDETDLDDIPEVRLRKKKKKKDAMMMRSSSSASSSSTGGHHPEDATQRVALTTSGEVEDVSKQGIYGCDAMVMLRGEEPEEDLMEEEASLSMIVDDVGVGGDEDEEGSVDDGRDDGNREGGRRGSGVDYDGIFATAEREYQRMRAHEASSAEGTPDGDGADDGTRSDIEAWLDDDDDSMDDEGATVVIGRAQFFMGAMREFIGMPASSAIDLKDRIMGSGVSAVARRKGSVHRLAESWDVGDYGKKDTDCRP